MNDVQKIFDAINQLPESIRQLGKDGVPVNVNVTSRTIGEFGLYLIGGLLLAGLAAGAVVGLLIRKTN